MRYTTGRIESRIHGNFVINIEEDYFIKPSIRFKIYWTYEKNTWLGKRTKSKLIYSASVSDRSLESARAQMESKLREKLPKFLKMEQEGNL